jgi:hypothetical protein
MNYQNRNIAEQLINTVAVTAVVVRREAQRVFGSEIIRM